MFGALKRGRFRLLASLILVVNVVNVGELRRKRTLAASRGFLAAARLPCYALHFSAKRGIAIACRLSVCL